MKLSNPVVAAFLLAVASSVHADEFKDFAWGELAVRLPKPLSDHTASLDPGTELIYIAGGCGRFNQF
jgi:hypothetical protein